MWRDLAAAFCLMLILEGILPFLNPRGWQQTMAVVTRLPPHSLRVLGLCSMLLGSFLLHWIRRG
jgi:uncharacterized protein